MVTRAIPALAFLLTPSLSIALCAKNKPGKLVEEADTIVVTEIHIER